MKIPATWRPVAASLAVLLAGSGTVVVTGEDGSSSRAWTGSWAAAVTHGNLTGSTNNGFTDQSVRNVVHLSVGGDRVRIRLSNIYGEKAVPVGHATVALPNTATPDLSDIDPATLHQLTFNGAASAVMPMGAELYSDPVDLRVPSFQDVVVSIYFPQHTGPTTFHSTSRQNNFVGPGDLASAPEGTGYTTVRTCCWFFVSGVDVLRSKAAGTVVVFGDSLADGHGSTFNGNHRWPDELARRLAADRTNGKVPGVLNASLGGSRLTHEGIEPGDEGFPGFPELGVNAQARLNEDVFAQTGVHTVIMDLGINDIALSNDPADKIIMAIRQLNQQVREKGLTMMVTTLAPFEGLNTWTPAKDAVRETVNTYLRSHRDEFDAVLDFDKALRDPARPNRLRPDLDSGDHIHPNDLGSQVMANAVPLRLVGP